MIVSRELREGWTFASVDEEGAAGAFHTARAPGCVYLDLIRLGEIPDPRYADNAHHVQDVGKRDWIYRNALELTAEEMGLSVAADRVELVFEGLDTFAEIRLNGEILGESRNMFVPWRAEAGPLLDKENVLEVFFHSPERIADARAEAIGLEPGLARSRRAVARMMALSWGMDPIHAFPGCGIWRPCRLEWHLGAVIHGLGAHTAQLGQDTAELEIVIECESFHDGPHDIRVEVSRDAAVCARASQQLDLKAREIQTLAVGLEIPEPRAWEPNGRGEAALYDLEVFVDRDGENLARESRKIGLRTIELAGGHEGGKKGASDRQCLLVNGTPLFVQGVNWLGADIFPSPGAEEKAVRALELLARSGANAVRVRGSGVYESEAFYQACDRLGLMVWQDFAFVPGPLDGGQANLQTVAEEIRYQVGRLRHHPSLAVWQGAASAATDSAASKGAGNAGAGNGGSGAAEAADGTDEDEELSPDDAFFGELIPRILAEVDPGRPYLAGDGREGWIQTHFRPGWKPAAELAELAEGLVAEAGLLSVPHLKTAERFLPLDDRQLNSQMVSSLTEGGAGEGLPRVARYVTEHFAMPVRFDDWIYKSQLTQAEFCRVFVERLRAAGDPMPGIFLWAWMDPCFGLTRMAVDCEERPKALAYAMKRFFAPVIAVLRETEQQGAKPYAGALELVVVNGRTKPLRAEAILEHWTLEGRLKGSKTFPVELEPGSSAPATAFRPSLFGPNPNKDLLVARVVEDGQTLHETVWLFNRPKFMQFPRIDVAMEVEPEAENRFLIHLRTPHVGLHVALETVTIERVDFDDNFFLLLPERRKTVRALCAEPVDAAEFRKDLSLRFMHDRPNFETQKPQGRLRE